jgi:protein-tyrosine-phosphatase
MSKTTRMLFVCSGNICRSPMAAAYMQHLVVERGLAGVFVDSAGTLGIDDAPPSLEAAQAMHEIGVDLSGHRSRGLRPSDLHSADLVIGMTHGHMAHMARWPSDAERHLIRAFEQGANPQVDAEDLDDPIGHDLDFYRGVRDVIVRSLDHLALRYAHEEEGAE